MKLTHKNQKGKLSMNPCRKNKIAVFGSASGDDLVLCKEKARVIGMEVAKREGILCTGACGGLPHEAAISAAEHGGLVLGFSPAMNLNDHILKHKFPDFPYTLIFTGMEKKGRNLICTRTCDAGIFIAGRWGTMNEFTFMVDEGEGKVIGLLAESGGFVDGSIIPALKSTDKPSMAAFIIDKDPASLVYKIFAELKNINNKKGENS